jgi:FkbM family methyltransferase
MAGEANEELQKWMRIAEEHAFGVRQCAAQRSRLFEALRVVGRVARFDNEPIPPGPAPSCKRPSQLWKVMECVERSPSQFLQDVFCLLFDFGKENGYFVEFGACEGLTISNTILLEREFGWSGLLAEPARRWQDALKQNRKCVIETRCIWSKTGEKMQFAEFDADDYHTQSTLVATSHGRSRISHTYDVETISLVDALRLHNSPRQIDLLSVDTEGSEFDILQAFPFDEYNFGFICVEHHADFEERRMLNLLNGAGYTQILRSVSGHDGFYIPSAKAKAIFG